MYNKLIFYTGAGNGDLFESREFVKDIMSFIPANEYYYAHNKSPRMFFDIAQLKHMKITSEMMERSSSIKNLDNFYLNTWIGRDAKYVLPQVGCVIEENYRMFNDILKDAGHRGLTKQIINYIPDLDFSKMDTSRVDAFVNNHKGRRLILICDGRVKSFQAFNFDFTQVVYSVAYNHKDDVFIVTTGGPPVEVNNVIPIETVVRAEDGFDLNDISYMAKFVDIIIGRKSGPAVFAHNKDVWYSNKKSLSFTYAEHSSHFVQGDSLPLKKYWSNATEIKDVINKIEGVLND